MYEGTKSPRVYVHKGLYTQNYCSKYLVESVRIPNSRVRLVVDGDEIWSKVRSKCHRRFRWRGLNF